MVTAGGGPTGHAPRRPLRAARARMVEAEREVATVLGDATEAMSINDLAKLAGLPASDLRRIHRDYADKVNGDTHSPTTADSTSRQSA